MLQTLLDAITSAVKSDQVTAQVAKLLDAMGEKEVSVSELMNALGLAHRATFRKNYLVPALDEDWIERTQPDSPRSPTQRYRLTDKGRSWKMRRSYRIAQQVFRGAPQAADESLAVISSRNAFTKRLTLSTRIRNASCP